MKNYQTVIDDEHWQLPLVGHTSNGTSMRSCKAWLVSKEFEPALGFSTNGGKLLVGRPPKSWVIKNKSAMREEVFASVEDAEPLFVIMHPGMESAWLRINVG